MPYPEVNSEDRTPAQKLADAGRATIELPTIPTDADSVVIAVMRDGKAMMGVRDAEALTLAVHSIAVGQGRLVEEAAELLHQAAERLTGTSWTKDQQLVEAIDAWLDRAFPGQGTPRG